MKQLTKQYYFSVAGINLCVSVDKELETTKAFDAFVVERQLADFNICFEKVCKLPEMSNNVIHEGQHYKVYIEDKDKFKKSFWDSDKKDVPYAISYYDENQKCINVQYLEKGEKNISDFQNTFVHVSFEEILMRHKRLCLHAACVETSYGGILFSGPSGIGKSTQAKNWCKYREAIEVNGDRPILSKDGKVWKAWGSPYAGSSKCHKNISCSVKAIVILKQSENCRLRKMSDLEAFRAVWAGVTVHSWDKKYMETACDMVMELIKMVPVFELCCTPDEQAVKCLETELRKECYK